MPQTVALSPTWPAGSSGLTSAAQAGIAQRANTAKVPAGWRTWRGFSSTESGPTTIGTYRRVLSLVLLQCGLVGGGYRCLGADQAHSWAPRNSPVADEGSYRGIMFTDWARRSFHRCTAFIGVVKLGLGGDNPLLRI